MVVCICNAIKEKDVRHAAKQGATTACSAYAVFGHRPKCAQCFRFAESIIAEERDEA
jgi:bacterioferritin-associated ferredoxin